MKKRNAESCRATILAVLFLLLFSATAAAYTSADFNRIKLDPEYLYGESTLESEDEAREIARVTLINYANRYFSENSIDRNLTAESDIDVEYMTMPRGNKTRVMAYIAKSALTSPSRRKASPRNTAAAADAPQLPEWQTQIIGSLQSAGNLADATRILQENKSIYKIKAYGTLRECLNAKSCFWVICNPSLEIIAILGQDTDGDRRYNFMTDKYDSLGNYAAQYGAWFQFR